MADISKLNVNNTDYNIKDATARTSLSNKMDKANPTGTGALSLNRKSGTTTGSYSVTTGYNNEATGVASSAEGIVTTASGDYSHTEGNHSIANHRSQHVFGEYNAADTSTATAGSRGNYVEIVGKGSSDANRSNARTLDWSGNETLAGDLKINGDKSLSTLWTVLSGLTALSEKSGSIASFNTDIADKLFSCYVDVTAVQVGSGIPAPDNVRAISGWSACNLTECGKNLVSGKVTGANINEIGLIVANADFNMNYAFVKKGVTYTTSLNSIVGGYFSSIPTVGLQALNSSRVIISASSFTAEYDGYFAFRSESNITNVILNVGSTPTTYEAYNGTTHNIPFNTTVYGGVLDVLSGVLTVTHILSTHTWSEFVNKSSLGNYTRGGLYITSEGVGIKYNTSDISNIAPYKAAFSEDSNHFYIEVSSDNTTSIMMFLPNDTDGSTSIQVCYELATPTVIQLTPTEVKTILGQNNIFGDCGDIDLKYLETIGNRL